MVVDPQPDGIRNPWRTYQLCLNAAGENPGSHTLILQDDAIPCEGFMEAAEDAVAVHPEALTCFFVPGLTRSNKIAMWTQGPLVPWSLLEIFVPVVATAWPSHLAADCAQWGAGHYGKRVKADDAVVLAYCKKHRVEVYATSPSLVEHDESVPSLMTQRVSRNRRALVPLNGQDPCGIQWV